MSALSGGRKKSGRRASAWEGAVKGVVEQRDFGFHFSRHEFYARALLLKSGAAEQARDGWWCEWVFRDQVTDMGHLGRQKRRVFCGNATYREGGRVDRPILVAGRGVI